MFTIDTSEILGYIAKRRFTKKEFAKKVGVSENTLRSYLNNPLKIPFEVLIKFAEVLDISIEEAQRIFFKQELTKNVNNEGGKS